MSAPVSNKPHGLAGTRIVETMVDHGISCLPVLNQGEVVGILTNTDLHLLLQLVLQTTKLSLLEEPNLSGTISR